MEKDLNKYHKKLLKEAIIKSIICGLIVGFSLALVLAIVFYFALVEGVWIIAGVWLSVSTVSAFLFKKFLFKTNIKTTAARMDSQLGLEERIITMVEYSDNSSSVVYEKQRDNAKEKLTTVTPKQLTFMNILKPIVSLAVIALIAIGVTVVSSIEVVAKKREEQIVIPNPPTKEDLIIQKMIEELRKIVNKADVSAKLKTELHELIDKLENDLKNDVTLERKIARIEDTRREILERIRAEILEKTTIIDELKKHDTTKDLGYALAIGKKENVDEVIDQIVTDFVAMSVEGMKAYVKELAGDIKQAVEDAQIKDPKLEKELEDLIQMLIDLIPKIEGDFPDEFGDELRDILEQLANSLATKPENDMEQDMDETIQDAIDELEDKEKEDSQDPKDPKDPEEGEENENGSGNPTKNPVIIDGETEFTQEVFEEMKERLTEMYESGYITEEELIDLINKYMENMEIK